MFGLEKDTFDSNRKTYLACAKMLRALLLVLFLSLLVLIGIGVRDGSFSFLAERSVWGMYLSGFLTSSSLWWACRWSAARADD